VSNAVLGTRPFTIHFINMNPTQPPVGKTTFEDYKALHQREERIATLLAAFLGLAATVWINLLMNVHQGNAATVAFILFGIPTYGLCMALFKALLTIRYRQKYGRQVEASAARTA
jgi:ABC-type Fe3+-siderophore transport system permease subunit